MGATMFVCFKEKLKPVNMKIKMPMCWTTILKMIMPAFNSFKNPLKCLGTPLCISSLFYKGEQLLCLSVTKPFQNGPTLKRKNLLLKEQILSLKSRPPFRREENMTRVVRRQQARLTGT